MDINKAQDPSLKGLWRISYPLMISFFSMLAMLFIDRLFLARYSTEALMAASQAGTLAWSIQLAWVTLASMAEVFVAQSNGAQKYQALGAPVWQMFYIALLSLPFFYFSGNWVAQWIFNEQLRELHYFRWILYLSPFAVFGAAAKAFYIGRGKTMIIQLLALASNGINIILDPLLIFGYKGVIPEMGTKGAAIATGVGVIIEAVILFALFVRRRNREKYGTSAWKFQKELFKKIVRVGIPPAFFCAVELSGWGLFYRIMKKSSPSHLLIASICQSILYLFFFFGCGLEKGAAAIAGNLIGSNQTEKVKRLFQSGLMLSLIFFIFTLICFVIFPHHLVQWVVGRDPLINGVFSPELNRTLFYALAISSLYIFCENVRWLLNGILTAAGDTLFIMISGALSIWLFMLIPTYYLVLTLKGPILLAFGIWGVYGTISVAIFYGRYASGKWKDNVLVKEKV